MAAPLALLVGDNVRRIRTIKGATQRQVATLLTELGLPWTSTRVAKLEAGDVAPSLPTLVFVAAALDRLPGEERVSVVDLVRAGRGDQVALSEGVEVPSQYLVDVLRGLPAGGLAEYRPCPPPEYREPPRNYGDFPPMDRRVAKDLGIGRDTMLALTRELWGHGLGVERDRRIAEHGLPESAKKRITTALREELGVAMRGGKMPENPVKT
jgi:transcriptional regulator with XRE-family HTH domain